jgi:hypothetical protein
MLVWQRRELLPDRFRPVALHDVFGALSTDCYRLGDFRTVTGKNPAHSRCVNVNEMNNSRRRRKSMVRMSDREFEVGCMTTDYLLCTLR